MQRNLFTYIWRHSKPEQIVILGLVVLSQFFYFLSLTVPKSSWCCPNSFISCR